jgi:hypothetical protein
MAQAPGDGKAKAVTSASDASLATPQARYQLFLTYTVGGSLAIVRLWIPLSNDLSAEGWSAPVVMVIGTPTSTVHQKL